MTRSDLFSKILEQAFPFFLACDREFQIVELGKSFPKFGDSWTNEPFDKHLEFRLPHIGELSFEKIEALEGKLVFIESRDFDLQLKGQVLSTPERCYFLVHPRFEDASSLRALGLQIKDFAPQSATVDLLLVNHAQRTQLEDLKDMVCKLELAAQNSERSQAAELALAHDLEAAADLTIRFDADWRVNDLRAVKPSYLRVQLDKAKGEPLAVQFPEVAQAMALVSDMDQDWSEPLAIDFQLHTSAGNFWFEARIAQTLEQGYLLLARDVTERRELERIMHFRALHDALTNLANRTLFLQNAAAAQQSGEPFSVFLIDVDDFKAINDNLGHHVGDEVLRHLAKRMQGFSGPHHLCARLGGDEFAILHRELHSAEQAMAFARGLVRALQIPFDCEGREHVPNVSVGVVFEDTCRSPADVIRDADFAMYEAKRNSGARVAICDEKVRESLRSRLAVKQDLGHALEHDEFVVFYQPIVAVQSLEVVGFEALVRWNHPTKGLLAPGAFLEIAEETAKLGAISTLVLKRAWRELAELNELFPGQELRMNVNLASQQIQDIYFLDEIRELLDATGLPPNQLTLEITEMAMIRDMRAAQAMVAELRSWGVRIALDDFGSGYSSLTYLQQFALDYVKLDRGFLNGISTSQEQSKIVSAVVQLSRALGYKTVAEGVEDEQQIDIVRELGCDYLQGFYFAKPMPFSHAADFLAKHQCEALRWQIERTSEGNSNAQNSSP